MRVNIAFNCNEKKKSEEKVGLHFLRAVFLIFPDMNCRFVKNNFLNIRLPVPKELNRETVFCCYAKPPVVVRHPSRYKTFYF
jgi:hypothetical protein